MYQSYCALFYICWREGRDDFVYDLSHCIITFFNFRNLKEQFNFTEFLKDMPICRGIDVITQPLPHSEGELEQLCTRLTG